MFYYYHSLDFYDKTKKEKNQKIKQYMKLDVNECSTNNGGCSLNANCANTIGSFTCTCKTGYTGNGVTCSGINFKAFFHFTK